MSNINRFYVKDGVVYSLEDTKPAEYLIGDENDLTAIAETAFPGSIAYTAGGDKWMLSPDREWVAI